MARIEEITGVFFSFRETAEPFVLPKGVKRVLSSRDQFVGITLVSHIPDEFVLGEVEDIMKGNAEFHHTEIRSEVSSAPRNSLDDLLSDLATEPIEFFKIESFDVRRFLYVVQDFAHQSIIPLHNEPCNRFEGIGPFAERIQGLNRQIH
jgi:hypothetical protein